MNRAKVQNDYFEWMLEVVCKDDLYRKLLTYLHDVEFTYHIAGDDDRAHDGVSLRHRFALLNEDHYDYIRDCLDGPCSVLEMIVALAIRCEESIMANPRFGDRTNQWFWQMIISMGLGPMTDSCYDERFVENTITDFLNRDYEPNGRGGLFTIRNSDEDLRKLPIWWQMLRYLNTIN